MQRGWSNNTRHTREVRRGRHSSYRIARVFFKSSKRLEGHVSLLCFWRPSPAFTCCLTQVFQVFRRHGLDPETYNLAWYGHKDAGSRFAARQRLPCKRT